MTKSFLNYFFLRKNFNCVRLKFNRLKRNFYCYLRFAKSFSFEMEFPDEAYRDICCIKTLYSTKEGFFNEFVRIMFEKIDSEWIEEVFKKQISEKDKIRICCRETKVWSQIQGVLKNVCKVYRKKCAEASKSSRMEGDWLCKKGDFKKAVMMYSQSIIRAPQSQADVTLEGYALPLAYKCRANALFNLKQYQECVTDLNMALKEGFPSALKYQIFRQMGECYKELLNPNKAQISLQLALKLIDDQKLKLETTEIKQGTKADKNKDFMLMKMLDKERDEIKEILHQITFLEGELRQPNETLTIRYIAGPLPDLTGAPNDKYQNASNLMTVKQSVATGRFATAVDKIDIGATLVVEEPHASCLIPQMVASHCLHCFTRLYTPVPCKGCSGVAFCSVRCRDLAIFSYHRYECEFFELFLGSGMTVLSFLSLRMITQEGFEFFKHLQPKIDGLEDKKKGSSVKFSKRESQYMNIYNLMTHSHLRTGKDYFRRTLVAIFLVKCLKKTDFFKPIIKENEQETFTEDEIFIASLILHHLELLQFNAHEIYETRMSEKGQVRNAKAVYIAVGIYPTVALFNHECCPSVTRYFNGKNIIIKSVRPLEKNEMLSENYGPHYAKKSLYDRARELTSRYWFKCECKACAEDWPLVEKLTDQHLQIRCKTSHCRGVFPQPQSTKYSVTNPICPHCSKKTNILEVLKRKSQIEILFNKALDFMDSRNFEKAVPLLTSYLNEIFQLVVPPCREIFLCQEALRTCFALTGNVWLLDD